VQHVLALGFGVDFASLQDLAIDPLVIAESGLEILGVLLGRYQLKAHLILVKSDIRRNCERTP
jgi:hypothetical protein